MSVNVESMAKLPGMNQEVTVTFFNGWQPGRLRIEKVSNVASAISLLTEQEWCWIPDESSYEALPIGADILADHLRSGDPALLMNRMNADLVHLQPATG